MDQLWRWSKKFGPEKPLKSDCQRHVALKLRQPSRERHGDAPNGLAKLEFFLANRLSRGSYTSVFIQQQ